MTRAEVYAVRAKSGPWSLLIAIAIAIAMQVPAGQSGLGRVT